jgi:hypothetical protein
MVSDVPDGVLPGGRVRADVEKAYRRGFHQGAALLLEALDEGADRAEVLLWLERLRAWRRRAAGWTGRKSVRPQVPPREPPYDARHSRGVRAWRRSLM